MTIKAKDFQHIVEKLGLQTRSGGHRLVWFEYEGKPVLWTRCSHKKGRDLPFQHGIRQQLKLNEDELRHAISCSLDRDQYVTILKQKGFL